MFSTLLICVVVATSIITVNAEKKYSNQSELLDAVIDNLFLCMSELEINPEVCTDLLMKDKDHSDKKYDSCKCFGPCVAKKMGSMNRDSGKWDWSKIKEFSTLLDTEMLISEAKLLQTSCYDEVNTHCEAGYAIMKCMLENSKTAQDMAKSFLAAKAVAMQNEE